MIPITRRIAFDEKEIEGTFVRAPRPDGQNVNKVASAVQRRFAIRQRRARDRADVAGELLRAADRLAGSAGRPRERIEQRAPVHADAHLSRQVLDNVFRLERRRAGD